VKNKPYPYYTVGQASNLKELLDQAAVKYGNAPAFTYERRKEQVSVNYIQFKADVEALEAALWDMGLQSATVAVIGENSYEWIVTYFAVVNGGGVIVPLDKELTAEEAQKLIAASGARVFVHSNDFSDIAVFLQSGQSYAGQCINMRELPALLEQGSALLQSGATEYLRYEIDNNALAAVLYTSGTTGASKGVMLSHQSITADVVATCENCFTTDISLFVLPLHHSFALTAGVLCMLHHGCNIVINKSLKTVTDDLKKYKPSNIMLVPLFVETFHKRIWDNAEKSGKAGLLRLLIKISNALLAIGIDVRTRFFKSVQAVFGGQNDMVVTGGAPIDSKYIKGFRDFGINVLNGYGITECSPIVSVNRNRYFRDGSVGQVIPGCEVKILDADESGVGEICVRGENVMLGYFNDDAATREAFDGEWFKTGDIGYLDADGFLFITGRKKNLIILSNGKNVSPEELEIALLGHIQYVQEAIIYAENDSIVAEVFLDPECEPGCAARLEQDIDALNQTLAIYKNIGKTVIRDTEFPKTTTKKIKRKYNTEGETVHA